jgi:hypothetical protein
MGQVNDKPVELMNFPPLPNPGSYDAYERGCMCPIQENNHGEGIQIGDCPARQFWINLMCPLHGGRIKKNETENS